MQTAQQTQTGASAIDCSPAGIKNAFTPVENLSPAQKGTIEGLNRKFGEVAQFIGEVMPEGALKDQAILKLLEVKWTAVHAVTHGGNGGSSAGPFQY